MITENLSTLQIHKLTQEQYDRELKAGNIDEKAIYITPDVAIDLSKYVTNDALYNYLPLKGGNLTGTIITNGYPAIRSTYSTNALTFCGGTSTSANAGAKLILCGADNSGSGEICLQPGNANGYKQLKLKQDGTMTWTGNEFFVSNGNGSIYSDSAGTNIMSYYGGDANKRGLAIRSKTNTSDVSGSALLFDWVDGKLTQYKLYGEHTKQMHRAGVSSSWYNGRDNAFLRLSTLNGYSPIISTKTVNGSWEIGSFNDPDGNYRNGLTFSYASDTHYSSKNNSTSKITFTNEAEISCYSILIQAKTSNGYVTDFNASMDDTGIGTNNSVWSIENATKGVKLGTKSWSPLKDKTCDLGHSDYRWTSVYAGSSTISTSDRNQKKDIHSFDINENYEKLFLDLKPVVYKFIDGESGRDHFGFISQDVEESLFNLGFDDKSFAGFCKDVKVKNVAEDPERDEIFEPDLDENGNKQYTYSLRYEEFISLNTYMIQKLYKKIESLEDEIAELKAI